MAHCTETEAQRRYLAPGGYTGSRWSNPRTVKVLLFIYNKFKNIDLKQDKDLCLRVCV